MKGPLDAGAVEWWTAEVEKLRRRLVGARRAEVEQEGRQPEPLRLSVVDTDEETLDRAEAWLTWRARCAALRALTDSVANQLAAARLELEVAKGEK